MGIPDWRGTTLLYNSGRYRFKTGIKHLAVDVHRKKREWQSFDTDYFTKTGLFSLSITLTHEFVSICL